MQDHIRVYNTLSRRLEPLVPGEPGHVRMYVCGMTVYDLCHIGHARAMITFDTVRRYLEYRGYRVTFVRNHTDVDDKIIARAAREQVDALALSNHYIEALEEDMAGLGLLPATEEPRVSRHIPEIIKLIEQIFERGHAYQVDGDVFFQVETFPHYGCLSGRDLNEARAGERVALDERKRHPADFALWKAARPGEPSWPSPWGPGRPGWHIECSAMSQHYLGETFDIHGGGQDLVFPHHENEIAQSEAATGKHPFVRYWMHNGMVTMADEKMSKSLGNIVCIRSILERMPGEALRLLYLEHHYRSPVPYSEEGLAASLVCLDRLYQAREAAGMAHARTDGDVSRAAEVASAMGGPALDLYRLLETCEERFQAAMDEDFNTARAVGVLLDLVRATNRLAGTRGAPKKAAPVLAGAHAAFEVLAKVLGLGVAEPGAFFEEMKTKRLGSMGLDRAWVEERLQARTDAREARDWQRADAIRDELDQVGITIMDGPEGTTWRVRV